MSKEKISQLESLRVKSKRENSPNNEINCFGLSFVGRGHNLFPEPPAKIIGLNFLELMRRL